jgi:hypothetical protein
MGGKRGGTSSRWPQNSRGAKKERWRDNTEEDPVEGEMEGVSKGELSRDYLIT